METNRIQYVILILLLSATVAAQTPDPAPEETIQDFFTRVEARTGVQRGQTSSLSLEEAIALALEKNTDIEVSRIDTWIGRHDVKSAEGYYDFSNKFNISLLDQKAPVASIFGGGGPEGSFDQSVTTFDYSLLKNFQWGGGNFELDFNNTRLTTSATFSTLSPQYNPSLSLTYTQPLIRNRSIDSGRYQVTQSKQSRDLTDVQFEIDVISVVNSVQKAYLDVVAAVQDLQNQEEAAKISYKQLSDNREAARLNLIAPIELNSNESNLESRKAALISSVQRIAVAEDTLKALITKDRTDPLWLTQLVPAFDWKEATSSPSLTDAVQTALSHRAEIRRQDLQIDQSALDVRFFENQTGPQVNLVGIVSSTSLSGTAVDEVNLPVPPGFVGSYGDSLKSMFSWDFPTVQIGVQILFPWGNRTANANAAKARLQKEQQQARRQQLEKELVMEVRNAVQQVVTTRNLVEASTAGRIASQKMLEGEQEKYRAGQSTNFLVLQRQDEYFVALSTELTARVNHQKAMVELQRATGMTLTENRIDLAEPPDSSNR